MDAQEKKNMPNTKLLKVVTIGGGTGQSVLLTGLKEYPLQLTAIVSMADDGGSTGVLRDELGVLPPGDVRMCLVALSNAAQELRELFQYRFENGGMSGHTLGNLFLSALQKTSGSFSDAITTAGKILQVQGRVIPVSEEDMRLIITLKDGSQLRGEHYLNDNEQVREQGVVDVILENRVTATKAAVESIHTADVIVIGPGGLYDSLLPPLLVSGFSEAIQDSNAKLIYISNLTNKKGQTEHFTVQDYVTSIEAHLGERKIDTVMCNSAHPDDELLKNYEEQEGVDALVVCAVNDGDSYKTIFVDVLANAAPVVHSGDSIGKSRSLIRHDSDKLAKAIVECIYEHEKH